MGQKSDSIGYFLILCLKIYGMSRNFRNKSPSQNFLILCKEPPFAGVLLEQPKRLCVSNISLQFYASMDTFDLALPWYVVGKNAIHENGASNFGRLIVKQGRRRERPDDGVSSAGSRCIVPKICPLRADRAELASSQWLREDAVVDQGEGIPFTGARVLGLEL